MFFQIFYFHPRVSDVYQMISVKLHISFIIKRNLLRDRKETNY